MKISEWLKATKYAPLRIKLRHSPFGIKLIIAVFVLSAVGFLILILFVFT